MNDTPARKNPFPGLRPFTPEEDYLFFGREEQTIELLQRLGSNRFVAVVGASGSGKSSLVRCGLLSELLGGRLLEAGAAWEVAVTHPGGNPLGLLTDALLDADLYDRHEESARENLLATLSRSHFGLVEAVKQAGLAAGTNFLLVVDQFEEIFRFHEAGQTQQEAANEFVSLLLESATQKETSIYIVLTMRSDFIGECGQFEGLAEMVNRGEFLIPRLSREQFKRVIEGPIKVAGGQIAPRLLQRLLNDLGQQADQLPCLQHALMRTWNVWAGRNDSEALDLDDYHRVGRMSQALSLHADEIYEALADDRQRELCRGLFQALTFEEANSRGIRRPQRLGRLCQILEVSPAELRLIIDAYRQSGVTFLMPSPNVELTDQTIIDISHESLMRVWTRLRQWVEDETQAAGIYHRLSESADLHAQGKAGLYRDPELGIALAWRAARRLNAAWAERYRPGFVMAITFLEESQRASVAEGQAHEAARQRELQQAQQLAEAQQLRLDQQQRAARKMRTMIWGLAVVAIIAVVAMVVALVANNNATKLAGVAAEEATEAKRQRKLAQDAAGATQNALIQAQTNLTKAEKAELLARGAEQAARSAEEAGRKLLYTTDMRLAPFVWRDDRTTAEQLRVLLAKHVPEGKPTTAKPDLRGFEWHYYEHLRGHSAAIFVGHPIAVAGAAFAAKDRLVTLDQHGQVRRWNLDAQAEVKASRRELVDGEKSLLQVLSADGRLAALGMEKKIVVFDTVTGAERYRIDSASTLSRHILFTPGSDRLIIVDDRIRWCDAATGIESARINQGFKRGSSLATSADGRMLAVVGHGTLGGEFSSYRLDADSKKVTALAKDAATGGTLSAAAVSSDGRLVALGRKLSGQLSVFDMTTGKLVANHGSAHASPISAMAFSGSDFKLVTADSEGILKVWEDARKLSAKSAASMTLKGHDAAITHVGFSANGKHLVSTSLDKTARVWDLDHAGAAILPLQRIGINCSVARFSPDGQLIAAADSPSVKLWDAATGQVVRQFPADADERVRAYSVAFSPTDPRLLAVGYGGGPDISHVALWDIDSGTPLARLIGATDIPDLKRKDEYGGTVGALAFSPDGKYLVAGFGSPNVISPATYPNPVKVWEVATRRLVRRLQGHTGFCVSLAFSRDGKRLASGSRDGTAILWSTADWTVERTLRNPDTATIFGGRTLGMVDEVAFSPDGQTLAMTSREGSVVLWDVAGGKMLDTLKGHSSSVGAAVFSPDGRTLATGGGDQTVRLWNVDTRRQLLQMDAGNVAIGSVESLAFSPDGKHLLMAGRAGAAFWSATPMLWSDPGRAAAHLRGVLSSDADFASRMRMYSENLRLHEALAHLDAKDVRVQVAHAAARANWLAAQGEWQAATKEYDRLVKCSPISPSAWLRTPGLIRVATALFHEGRSTQAASLLTGGARRRAMDGLPPQDADDFDDPATGELCDPLLAAIEARLAKNPRDAGVLELRAELAGQWSDTRAQLVDYTVAIDALAKQKSESADLRRLQGRRGIAYVRLERWKEAVADFARAITKETTDEELLTNQALALAGVLLQSPKHQSVLKIADAWVRLAAAYRVSNDQAAIDALVRRRPASIAAIGDLFAADRAWPRAVDIYSQGITDKTTDPLLLAKRARGHEALKKWDAAAVDWSRAAASDPDGATLLADFARRLAAAGQVTHAMRQFDKAQDRYERVLAADPSNDLVATDLTQLLLDRHEHSAAAIDRRGVHSAVLRISDPWLKLGAAYAANGNEDAASGYFTRTLHKNANATRHVVRDLTEVVLGPLLANAARAKLRGEMFEALKTELALYRKQLQSDRPDERAAALDAVHAWQTDDDLAVLRTPAALAGLPVDELKAFNQLWAELAELHFKGIAAAPADRQIVHVADWFTKLNPGFDGKLTHKSEGNVIASLEVHAPVVQDLSPLQALTGLSSFVGRPTLGYDNNAARDARLLRSLKTLETINGKPVAKFWQDAQTRQAEFNQWLLQVPKLSPKEQANAVLARLKERNPGSPCYVTHMAEGNVVTELWIHEAYKLTDISPVRALANLKSFKCDAGAGGDLADLTPLASLTKLNAVYVGSMKVRDLAALKDLPLTTLNLSGCNLVGDLSPLRGLPLITLELHLCTSVHDLTPLKGMPLTNLNLHDGPKVVDLAPLRGMQLTDLWLGGNRILDLSPLKGMPLKSMSLSHCVQLQDLSPLRGLPLETLYLDDTKVRDLAPLKNLPLKKLYVNTPGVTDLRPLQGIALEDIRLTAKNISHGLDMLRAMKSLQRIGTDHYQSWPTAEYWARFDKGEFKK